MSEKGGRNGRNDMDLREIGGRSLQGYRHLAHSTVTSDFPLLESAFDEFHRVRSIFSGIGMKHAKGP